MTATVKTATWIRAEVERDDRQIHLFRVEPPICQTIWLDDEETVIAHEHVIVSGVYVMGRPETFIFGCGENGEIHNFGELHGSFTGGINVEEALAGAGYTIVGMPLEQPFKDAPILL